MRAVCAYFGDCPGLWQQLSHRVSTVVLFLTYDAYAAARLVEPARGLSTLLFRYATRSNACCCATGTATALTRPAMHHSFAHDQFVAFAYWKLTALRRFPAGLLCCQHAAGAVAAGWHKRDGQHWPWGRVRRQRHCLGKPVRCYHRVCLPGMRLQRLDDRAARVVGRQRWYMHRVGGGGRIQYNWRRRRFQLLCLQQLQLVGNWSGDRVSGGWRDDDFAGLQSGAFSRARSCLLSADRTADQTLNGQVLFPSPPPANPPVRTHAADGRIQCMC